MPLEKLIRASLMLIHTTEIEQKDGEIVGEERGMEKRLEQGKLGSEILPYQHRNECKGWLQELIPICHF